MQVTISTPDHGVITLPMYGRQLGWHIDPESGQVCITARSGSVQFGLSLHQEEADQLLTVVRQALADVTEGRDGLDLSEEMDYQRELGSLPLPADDR